MSLVMPGVDGLARMQALMEALRRDPPESLGGDKVLRVRDYLSGESRRPGEEAESMPLRGSDMLAFELRSGGTFFIRPSGTEPKVKCYLQVRGDSPEDCARRLRVLEEFAEALPSGQRGG